MKKLLIALFLALFVLTIFAENKFLENEESSLESSEISDVDEDVELFGLAALGHIVQQHFFTIVQVGNALLNHH